MDWLPLLKVGVAIVTLIFISIGASRKGGMKSFAITFGVAAVICGAVFWAITSKSSGMEAKVAGVRQANDEALDVLRAMRGKASAATNLDAFEEKFGKVVNQFKELSDFVESNKRFKKIVNAKALEDFQSCMLTTGMISEEIERLRGIEGLPVDFWKRVDARWTDYILVLCDFFTNIASIAASDGDSMKRQESGDFLAALKSAASDWSERRRMIEALGYEKVVFIKCAGISSEAELNRLCEKIRPTLPENVRFLTLKSMQLSGVLLGPCSDFDKLAKALGAKNADEGQRTIKVDPRALKTNLRATANGLPNSPSDGSLPDEDIKKRMEENKNLAEERLRKMREEQAARIAALKGNSGVASPHRGDTAGEANEMKRSDGDFADKSRASVSLPDSSDPAYVEKLLEMTTSDRGLEQEKAINALLDVEPSSVSSETRKKVAMAFRNLAKEDLHFGKEAKVVQGLAKWGGKYSVPILLEILDDKIPTARQKAIYAALAELKDPRGAKVLVKRLGSFHMHEPAVGALRSIGTNAEDALLDVAPSSDPKICLAAIELLGDGCGTKKSLSFLRKAVASSKNPDVRRAATTAIKEISRRDKESGRDDKDAKEEESDL